MGFKPIEAAVIHNVHAIVSLLLRRSKSYGGWFAVHLVKIAS